MTRRSETVINYTVLLFFTVLVLLPILWTVLAALSPNLDGTPSTTLRFSNFASAWTRGDLGHALVSSLVITAGAVLVQVLLALGSGYAFGVLDVIALPGALPARAARADALDRGADHPAVLPVPRARADQLLARADRDPRGDGACRSAPSGCAPPSVPCRPRWWSPPRLDGAGTWRVLWRILVPVSKPAILTLVLLNAMWTWNDYFVALIMISDPAKQPRHARAGRVPGPLHHRSSTPWPRGDHHLPARVDPVRLLPAPVHPRRPHRALKE